MDNDFGAGIRESVRLLEFILSLRKFITEESKELELYIMEGGKQIRRDRSTHVIHNIKNYSGVVFLNAVR